MLIRLVRSVRVELLPVPTFIFRRHRGQRGAAAVRHDAGDREKIWDWPLPLWAFTAGYVAVFAYVIALWWWAPPEGRIL